MLHGVAPLLQLFMEQSTWLFILWFFHLPNHCKSKLYLASFCFTKLPLFGVEIRWQPSVNVLQGWNKADVLLQKNYRKNPNTNAGEKVNLNPQTCVERKLFFPLEMPFPAGWRQGRHRSVMVNETWTVGPDWLCLVTLQGLTTGAQRRGQFVCSNNMALFIEFNCVQ